MTTDDGRLTADAGGEEVTDAEMAGGVRLEGFAEAGAFSFRSLRCAREVVL
ncbi:MAG: hypothetical protein HPY76_10100 [Anaerolineae bacterium]|jgi:hypothetical protein|nr:hypothetical protein [Anaerolineae bacterium]